MPPPRGWVERAAGARIVDLRPLPGGAGRRRYFRITFEKGASRILMHAVPEDPAILPPALRNPGERIDWVEMTRLLSRFAIPVPKIDAVDVSDRWVLLEDLGDVRLADLEGETLRERRIEAARLLARIHEIPRGEGLAFERAFDEEWIVFELEHFLAHGVPQALRAEVGAATRVLVERISALPRTLCLRDYQSHNLMIDPEGRLRVLDYQDALLAPPELDLAAFLHDSYLEPHPELREELLGAYERARGARVSRGALALLVVQRKCKDLARYRYLVERGDARFAPYRIRARDSVLEALHVAAPEIGDAATSISRALEEDPP
jgi:aminoglycoside/choline kinase family phosphotransferase